MNRHANQRLIDFLIPALLSFFANGIMVINGAVIDV